MWAPADEGPDAARRFVRVRPARRDRRAHGAPRDRAARSRPLRARGAGAHERADRRGSAEPGSPGRRLRPIGDGWNATRSGTRPTSAGGSSSSTATGPCSSTPTGEDVGEDFATAGRPEVAQALDSQAVADVRRSDEEGGDIAVGAAPIIDEGELVGAVRISRGVQTVQENVGRATAAIAAVALGGLVAGLVLAVALARSIARPMTRLATTARSFGEGELSSRAGPIEGGRGVEGAGALLRRDGGTDGAHGSLAAGVRRERLPPAPHATHGDQAAARGRDRRYDRSEDPRRAAGGRSGGRSARADHRAAAHDGHPDRGGERPAGRRGRCRRSDDRAVERASGAGVVDALGAGPRGRVGGGRPRRRRSGPRRADRQRAQATRPVRSRCARRSTATGWGSRWPTTVPGSPRTRSPGSRSASTAAAARPRAAPGSGSRSRGSSPSGGAEVCRWAATRAAPGSTCGSGGTASTGLSRALTTRSLP